MARRKAFLHIGLPHSGGAFLDSALAEHARSLHDDGVTHPAISAEEMFRAAIEIRRDHKAWGYQRREVEGTWAGICRRAARGRGDVVFSQELLAAATPEQIALLLDGLAGFSVHVVITTRDPASQVIADWAGSVESGRTVSFARFRERIMDEAREHPQARRFWAGQELGEVLERWSGPVRKPDRVHVVVVPRGEPDPRPAVWSALGRIVGFDASRLPLRPGPGPAAVDSAEVAVIRTVNRAIDGRIEPRTHRRVVRRYLSEGVAGGAPLQGDSRPSVPLDLYADLLELGERWGKQIADAGYDVHGDVTDLLPERPVANLSPDEVSVEDRLVTTTNALANVLVEVARLREHNEALESRNAKLDRKRRKLKVRLAEATTKSVPT